MRDWDSKFEYSRSAFWFIWIDAFACEFDLNL